MKAIILLILFVVALGAVLEMRKRKAQKKGDTEQPQPAERITADQAGPTETGRFRVQEMLKRTEKSPRDLAEQAAEGEEEEESLPDPFGADDRK